MKLEDNIKFVKDTVSKEDAAKGLQCRKPQATIEYRRGLANRMIGK